LADRKSSLKRRLGYRLGGMLLSAGMGLAKILPLSWCDSLGKGAGKLGFYLNRKHRTRCISNLRMCWPNWNSEQVRATAMGVFRHFGKTAMRFLASGKLEKSQILDSVAAFDDKPIFDAHAEGKGVLLIGAHFGNWERAAQYLTAKGFQVSVVARNANDARTTAKVNKTREGHGLEVLARGNAAKEILRALRNQRLVAILPDQNASDVFVPFFGFMAGTVSGPAVIHLRTGAPIVIVMLWEREDGRYEGYSKRLIVETAAEDREKSVEAIMTQINKEIEAAVREHPEQWLWMHDRWKTARERGLLNA